MKPNPLVMPKRAVDHAASVKPVGTEQREHSDVGLMLPQEPTEQGHEDEALAG